jgi:CDP-glucose 4,6-dehydratase
MFGDFYRNRRILVTGHTGFKGAWLSLWLRELGAEVSGFSDRNPTRPSLGELLPPKTFHHDLRGDIADAAAVRRAIRTTKPEFIFHLAAQPLVRLSYRQPLHTLQTNVMGTACLLEAVRELKSAAHVLVVTTDKCYENRNWAHGYRETDALGGHDVYSSSKAGAELVTQSWRRSFFEPDPALGNVASARAGNVIGGGDYAADRIIPECVHSLRKKEPIFVRNPAATRPWQHVLDCLSGYLLLGWCLATAGKNSRYGTAFNFGPPAASNRTVGELVQEVLRTWPGEWTTKADPNAPHEATLLHLATDQAAQWLQWFPVWNFADTVRHTTAWYQLRHGRRRADLAEFSRQQIATFVTDARAHQAPWASQ